MSVFNPVSLVKIVDVPTSAMALSDYILKGKPADFSIEKVSNAEYIFFADISFGTLIKNGRPPIKNWIQTKVILTSINKNKCVVTLKTKLRFELILTLAAWVLFSLYQVIAQPGLFVWVATIFFPAVLLLQFLLYRTQEVVLQTKAERYLSGVNNIAELAAEHQL